MEKRSSYKHLQGKPMLVQNHPETQMPPRQDDLYTPPDPAQSLQGPQANSPNAFY